MRSCTICFAKRRSEMAQLLKRTHFCGSLRVSDAGTEVTVNGWVARQRSLGGIIFTDLRDKTGNEEIGRASCRERV